MKTVGGSDGLDRSGCCGGDRARFACAILDRRGQSTIEFALTLMLIVIFSLFYVQLSLVFAYGNFVHYATFMSARAYLASGPSKEDQATRARDVILRTLQKSAGEAGQSRFPALGKGIGPGSPPGFQVDDPPQFDPVDRAFSWMQGVRYTFRSRLFTVPLGRSSGGGAGAGANTVTLTSESWLGREPSYEECMQEMGERKGIVDNGC
jgi:hypothetical protein